MKILGNVEDGSEKKMECPRCAQSRAKGARYCLFCHAELSPPKTTLDANDNLAFCLTAENAKAQLEKLPVAQILVSDQLPDGSLPNLKRLVVQPGTFTVMVSQFHGTKVLEPGPYECSRLGIGGGLKAAFQAGSEPRPIFFCTVSRTPVTATFVLPDRDLLFEETGESAVVKGKKVELYDVDSALSRLGIRTSDNFLGGAQVQLVLRCASPAQLLEMFIQSKLQSLGPADRRKLGLPVEDDSGANRQQKARPGGVKGLFAYSCAVVARLLWGSGTPPATAEPVALSVWDVYREIRMEFAAAIGQSVRNEPIAHLFDAVEVRDRIAEDIQKIMSRSFDMYGIKIERVSAFRFICPKYEELLERRVNIAIDGQQLDDRRKEVDIAKKQRRIDIDDRLDSSHTETELHKQETSDQGKRERHEIEETRQTELDRDVARAEQQVRTLAMDETDHLHKLGKDRATEEQRLELQAEQERQRLALQAQEETQRLQLQAAKMDMALGVQVRVLDIQSKQLDLQNKQQDALLQRQIKQKQAEIEGRIKMIEQYAKLPRDSILTIALAENPQLAAAYAASIQAQSHEAKAQMQEKFRAELTTAYQGNNAQYTQLLQEAVRQWGHYQVAKQIGHEHPQQVINVGVPKPTDEPAPEQGEPSGEPSNDSSP